MRSEALALVALALAGCLDPVPDGTLRRPPTPASTFGAVRGRVVDHCTGSPVTGKVILTVRPSDAVGQSTDYATDGEGLFRIADLRPGTYQMSVHKKVDSPVPGLEEARYEPGEGVVVIVGGVEEALDITLLPRLARRPTQIKLDVLFVIDTSRAMGETQRLLASAFPAFVDRLLGGLSPDSIDKTVVVTVDLHVGAISSDLGAGTACTTNDGGRLRTAPGCFPSPGGFLAPPLRSGPGIEFPARTALRDSFACIAELGTSGCIFQQPLLAARRALSPELGINPGFLRDDAALAVILVTDGDDCSAAKDEIFDRSDTLGAVTSFRCFEYGAKCREPARAPGLHTQCRAETTGSLLDGVSFYEEFLRGLRKPVFLGVLAGGPEPVQVDLFKNPWNPSGAAVPALQSACGPLGGAARPAIRLHQLVHALAPHSAFVSLCGDMEALLTDLAAQIMNTTVLPLGLPDCASNSF